ncbi:MAG: cytochrome c biogenesis protein CcsA [Anaerolineae bacterium]|nr:cytochrome c biogenesis protein CcsA [Phycisphaerae bacterium]
MLAVAETPNLGQTSLLIAAIAFFVVGGVISLSRIKFDRPWSRIAAKACFWSGVTTAVAVLIWHAMARQSWIPLDDNFEAFIWLGVMLALFVMYVQRTNPIGGLDWFIMPIVILLMIAAIIFGSARPHEYVRGTWNWVHRVSAYGGAVAFAIAGAAGAMYLISNRRLRVKTAVPGPNFGSLERLEHVTIAAVTLGFALLTVGAITGIVQIVFEHRAAPVTKIVLTACVWIVYGVVLHSPINPSFRGKRTAMLSIVGFLLMVSVLVAVQFLPQRTH